MAAYNMAHFAHDVSFKGTPRVFLSMPPALKQERVYLIQMTKKRYIQPCVYCHSNADLTRDHVPPKCFFPKPRPADLITVPACRRCNQHHEKDEEFFLASLMFSDAGIGEAGRALWQQTVRSMLFRKRGVGKAIRTLLRPVELRSPAGLYLRNGYALEIDYARLESVVRKIVKGLYFHEFGEPLVAQAQVESNWLNTRSVASQARPYVERLPHGSRSWPGVFEYRCGRTDEAPDKSIWLMMFFGVGVFWSITGVWTDVSR